MEICMSSHEGILRTDTNRLLINFIRADGRDNEIPECHLSLRK
jgi:hypothetical protein